MTYRAILTPVADAPEVEPHLSAAVEAARAFDALLIGSAAEYCLPTADIVPMDVTGAVAVAERSLVETDLDAAAVRFRNATIALGGRSRFVSSIEFPSRALIRHAALADLLVVGSTPSDKGDILRHASVGEILMQAGRPVLAVGPGGMPRMPSTVAISWKNCREARRAVADALPFLRRAETVLAFVSQEGDPERSSCACLTPLIDYLETHGVRCTGVTLPHTDRVGTEILAAAARSGADLLVSGAYGRSRVQEWVFGGATRTYLSSAHIPVLFSH
jgi:nucleotide-binding universal stress UspA family protein